MFDEVTAQRLDRLERETSRRKWDSALTTAAQRSQHELASGAAQAVAAGADKPLVDLLDERFDRLERKNERLEWQLSRMEQQTHLWKRPFIAALVVVVGLIGTVGYLAIFPHMTATPTRRAPRSASFSEHAPGPRLDETGMNASNPLVLP